jgi:beta-1,4-mannosyltransferase
MARQGTAAIGLVAKRRHQRESMSVWESANGPTLPRMAADPTLPVTFRARILARDLREAVRKRRPRRGLRALAAFVFPGRWAPRREARAAALGDAVRAGGLAAAGATLEPGEGSPNGSRPGSPAALRRARALALRATALTGRERETEQAVVAFLRREFGPPGSPPAPDPAAKAAAAATLASDLRIAGHRQPMIIVTVPGFHANPFARLMEQAYPQAGFAAIPVERADEIERIVEGSHAGGYGVVIHVNGPDRFVRGQGGPLGPGTAADRVLRDVDRWLALRASLVMTIHNGPRLRGPDADAERLVAQGLADRASLVHLLAADTAAMLAGWIKLDPSRCIHIPHPSYDGAYGPAPDRDDARRALGFDSQDVVVGLIGALAGRKEGELLLDALSRVPDPLPDGRRLRLVLAGILTDIRGESMIRRAMADPRVVGRFGFVEDVLMPGLLAALDVAVVPYERFLNSGWLHLALTAGLPVIASDGGNAAEVARPAALRLFRAGDAGALASMLAAAGELTTPEARAAARESVADLDPGRLSARFVEAVTAAVAQASP